MTTHHKAASTSPNGEETQTWLQGVRSPVLTKRQQQAPEAEAHTNTGNTTTISLEQQLGEGITVPGAHSGDFTEHNMMLSPNLRLPLLQAQVCCTHVHPSAWAARMPERFRIPRAAIKP